MLRFSWDRRKSERNLQRRGISFESASLVFDDPNLCIFEDRTLGGEERIHVLGEIPVVGLLLVVALYEISEDETEEHVRIISARLATRAEAVSYYERL